MKPTNPYLSENHAAIFAHGLERARDKETLEALAVKHAGWLLEPDVSRLRDLYIQAAQRIANTRQPDGLGINELSTNTQRPDGLGINQGATA